MVHTQKDIFSAINKVLLQSQETSVSQPIYIKNVTLDDIPLMLVGKHGLTCPHCNMLLKNRATLTVHLRKQHQR
jgi:hypothetical protein